MTHQAIIPPTVAGSEIARQASLWLSRIHEGPLTEAESLALAAWRNTSAEHEQVWQRAGRLSSKLKDIPAKLGVSVLGRPESPDRRAFIKPAALLMLAAPSGLIAYRYLPWSVWSADYSTAVGGKLTVQLADGSRMTLSTDSAADVVFDASRRLIRLQRGDLYIETGKDALHRPFQVETNHGVLTALGTKFMVSKQADYSYLGVVEGAVDIAPHALPSHHMVIHAGEQVKFSHTTIMTTSHLDPGALGWLDGILYADDMRLADLIANLSRFRPGILTCDASAAELRISGAFQLDDIDKVLDVLIQTRPVRIVWRTRYWGTVYKTT